ncbi:MAG: PKD domain-containing protein [Saprospiraceae bacterium]
MTFFSTTTGDFINYSWSFGALSFPSSATRIGPHDIRFLAPGTRIIRLIVSNSFGTDTLEQTLYIRDYSSADFTSVVNGLEVDFTSTSTGAESYLWDFGDGNTSTEPNPTHTYASPGMYNVNLVIVGLCGDDEETQVVTTTSAITGIDMVPVVQVIPNPTPDNFLVALTAAHPVDIVLELNDVSGRQIKRIEQTLAQGLNEVRFEGLDLPSGLYPLNLITPSGTMTIHVAIQR